MDGVLIDSEGLYKTLEQKLFEEVGARVSHEEHVSYQGSSNSVMWSLIREKHHLAPSTEELVRVTEEKVIDYFSSLSAIDPMPGVIEILDFLKGKGVKIALASSSSIDVIRLVLEKTAMKTYFDAVTDCTEAGAGKPDPAIFRLTQQKLGIPKENCVIIEDSTNGIRAANAAGIYCIAFNGPGSEHQDQSASKMIISKFADLQRLPFGI